MLVPVDLIKDFIEFLYCLGAFRNDLVSVFRVNVDWKKSLNNDLCLSE